MRDMNKNSLLSHNSGTYTSPGTPDYLDNNVGGIQKGWSSERVPMSMNASRRHLSAAALMPFNSGRTLPSKWDNAERWITSPISGYGVNKTSSIVQSQRQSKSKSGPLGAPGTVCYSNYSPAMPVLQGGSVRNFMVGSPFTTGVLVPYGVSIDYGNGSGVQCKPVHTMNNMAQVVSLPGWSDLLSESSLPSSQDEKLDYTKDSADIVSPVVSRQDMATQMSPTGSSHPSPEGRSSFSTSPHAILSLVEPNSNHSAKLEVRDVQVDKRAITIRQSKERGSPDIDLTSPWDAEATKNMSKLQRDEAKITAWENLQKAKAEAAIRKLEMKLEKKRSATMDKILNKLRIAQMKAQDMRSSTSDSHACQVPRTSHKIVAFHKYIKMRSLSGCFNCHAR